MTGPPQQACNAVMCVIAGAGWVGARSVLAVAACVLWLGACAVDNADARGLRFGPAAVVGDQRDRGRAVFESVTINARKEAIAVWTRNSVVRVGMRSAGGRWGPPVTVSRLRSRNRGPGSFRAAMNASGDAVIAWIMSSRVDEDAPFDTVVVTRRAGRGWSAPVTWHNAGLAGVGLTGRGVAVLAWTRANSVRIAEHRDSQWTPVARFAAPEDFPSVALDVHANGRAAAMWSSPQGFFASRRSPRGVWSAPETVCMTAGTPSCLRRNIQPLEVSVARNGQIIGIASATEQRPTVTGIAILIEVFEYRPSAGWSAPQTVTTGEESEFDAAVNDRGEAIVGWHRWKPTPKAESPQGTVYGHMEAWTAARSATGAWSPPHRLTSPRHNAMGDLRVGITGAGEPIATWTESQLGTRGKPLGIRVATGSASTGWRRSYAISRRNPRRPGEYWQLSLAAEGSSAIIGWGQVGEGLAWVAASR